MRYTRAIATPQITLLFIRATEEGDKFWSDVDQVGAAIGALTLSTRGAYALTRGRLPPASSARLLGVADELAAPRAGLVPPRASLGQFEVAFTEVPSEQVYAFPTTLAEFRDHFQERGDELWSRWVESPDAVVELFAVAQAGAKSVERDPVDPDAEDTEGFREAFPGEDPNIRRAEGTLVRPR